MKILYFMFFILIVVGALWLVSEDRDGFVVSVESSGLMGRIYYRTSFGGEVKSVGFIGFVDTKKNYGMYFSGKYNQLLKMMIWMDTWGYGLTEDLIYLKQKFPLDGSSSKAFLGLKGFSGNVPGINVELGCGEDLYIDSDDIYWLEGTDDMIFSEDHQSAIEEAKEYALQYNKNLYSKKCNK